MCNVKDARQVLTNLSSEDRINRILTLSHLRKSVFAIQMLLPLRSNTGTPFPRSLFEEVSTTLTDRFGRLTAYVRAPASGVWQDENGKVKEDDVIVYEVVATNLERDWWNDYRKALEMLFGQDEIMIRAQKVWKL
jgi:hypothetical protein